MYKYSTTAVFALIALLFFTFPVSAFSEDYNDKCFVHLDKSFYVNGEVIWYKVYLPRQVENKPVALKAFLQDEAGNTVDYIFLKTEGKTYTSGYYKIPFDCSPGVYHLLITAMDDTFLEAVVLADIEIPIYNDQEIPPSAVTENTPKESGAKSVFEDLKVVVELENNSLKPRDEAKINIRVTDANGQPVQANLSVAVTDWKLSGTEVMDRPSLNAGNSVFPNTFYSLRSSVYTKARLVNEEGSPLQANVLGTFSPKENQMLYTKTNQEGIIFLELPEFYGSKSIQYLGYENEYEEISIAPIPDPVAKGSKSLHYSPEIIEYLNYSRQRKKIYQMFTALEFQLDPEIPNLEGQVFEPDYSLNIQEYERFDNMAAFFREILTPLRFREVTDSIFIARMYNPRMKRVNNYFPGKPLFIIDGKLTRNGDFIAKMKLDHVQRVDIFYEPAKLKKMLNVFGNNGMVQIITDLPEVSIPSNDNEDIVHINGYQAPLTFPAFTSEEFEGNSYRPFFRPQLYWNPQVETNGSGQASCSFFQSDDLSTFRIEVVAQAKDGTIGRGQVLYSTK